MPYIVLLALAVPEYQRIKYVLIKINTLGKGKLQRNCFPPEYKKGI
jgi:hypothetical protein